MWTSEEKSVQGNELDHRVTRRLMLSSDEKKGAQGRGIRAKPNGRKKPLDRDGGRDHPWKRLRWTFVAKVVRDQDDLGLERKK